MATGDQREHQGAICRWLISKAPKIHYDNIGIRPMRTRGTYEQDLVNLLNTPTGGLSMDCSEAVTLVCRLAGLHDPTGLNYNGYGGSESMRAYLPRPQKPVPHTGAIVVWPNHAAMCLVADKDPLLFSHGSEQGPAAIRLSVLDAAITGPHTWLSAANL